MTDKPKTIQEALAQVQELAVRPPVAKFGAKQMLGTAALAGGAAIASSPEAREKISNAYQGTKDFVKHSLGMDKTPEQSATSLQKAGEKISGAVTTAKNAVTGGGSTPPAPAKTETPKTEPAKTETPPAGSSAAKMSFADAYAKARQIAKSAGKDPNIAQFKWSKDGGPEKTYQAAETKANYVTKNKQFAVDINAPSTTKNPAGPPSPNPTASTTPKADATGMPPTTTRNIPAGSEGAKYPAEGGVRQAATGTFEKGEGYATIREPKKPETESGGKKRMSEEHINELSNFGAAFAAARRAGKSEFSFGGKSFNTRLASSSPSKPSGPQGAPGLVGPGAKVTRLDAPLPPSRPNTQGPRQPAEQGAPIPKTDKVPGSSTGDATPRPSTTPPINQTQQKPLQPVDTSKDQDSDLSSTMRIGSASSGSDMPISRPEIVAKANKETNYSYESGGKKKMSEENNKLIDMFLRLQEKHALTPNIFEAAKKVGKMEEELKGNQHRIDANKNGKIDAHDFKLLRAKKNVKEGEGDETAKKETSMSVTMDNKPSTPAQTTAATSGPSAADKKALDTKIKSIAKEEVEFSQAEIDHINSFFEAVAPSRAEPTKGVNPTVRNTDLTDETLEEGRPRKNPTPETTERDARQHIQVQAGRAAGGTVVDFNHDNGKVSKLTPGMGRAITAHLNGLKPAERQEAVKKMHASPEGLKV